MKRRVVRSPRLTEEEWIILLDLYLRHRGQGVTARHPGLVEASELLNLMGEETGRKCGPNFRQPDGLRRELGAFRHLDPLCERPDQKKATTAQAVWERFADDPEACHRAAQAIREAILGNG